MALSSKPPEQQPKPPEPQPPQQPPAGTGGPGLATTPTKTPHVEEIKAEAARAEEQEPKPERQNIPASGGHPADDPFATEAVHSISRQEMAKAGLNDQDIVLADEMGVDRRHLLHPGGQRLRKALRELHEAHQEAVFGLKPGPEQQPKK
jgi:hypothetical protein